MLSPEELSRYKRHVDLPHFGLEAQEKLKNAKVLVIGTGGLGAPVLNYLTAAGVGTIGMVDADLVDASNLQRQILFTTEDVEQPKVEIAQKRLSALNPLVSFQTWNEFYTSENALSISTGFDILVNCCDNYDARYACDEAAAQLNIPLVMGSIHNYEGQVSVFHYKEGKAYKDAFPEAPDRSLFAPQDLGVLGVLPSITGSLQASEVIKIISGVGEVLAGKLLIFSLWDNSFKTFRL